MFSAIFPKKVGIPLSTTPPPTKKKKNKPEKTAAGAGIFTNPAVFQPGIYVHHDNRGKNQFLLISVLTSPPEIKRFGLYLILSF